MFGLTQCTKWGSLRWMMLLETEGPKTIPSDPRSNISQTAKWGFQTFLSCMSNANQLKCLQTIVLHCRMLFAMTPSSDEPRNVQKCGFDIRAVENSHLSVREKKAGQQSVCLSGYCAQTCSATHEHFSAVSEASWSQNSVCERSWKDRTEPEITQKPQKYHSTNPKANHRSRG